MRFGGAPDESFSQTWLRRAVTVPLFYALWALAILTLPLTLFGAAVYDLAKDRRFPAVRTILMFAVFLTAEVVGVTRATLLWLRWRASNQSKQDFIDGNLRLQRWWAMSLYRWAVRLYSLRVEIEDDGMQGLGRCIVFVRHVCVVDNLVPYVTITEAHGVELRWALNRYLLREPVLDIVGSRLPNVFVRNDRTNGGREVERVVRLGRNLGPKEGVQMFPEGALFNPGRRERALQRIRESGDADLLAHAERLQHTLPPRLGGTLGLLEANEGADAVFVSHSGLEAAGSYRRIFAGGLVGKTLSIKLWRVPYAAIPRGREALTEWFYREWQQVDDFVGDIEREQAETAFAKAS